MNLSKFLFWDVDYGSIDWEKHAGFVISRVLMRGILSDWQELNFFYGKEKILKEALNARYLDTVTLNFCSFYFNVPKEKFRCCNTPQSIRQLWPY